MNNKTYTIPLTVNGESKSVTIEARTTLLSVLRDHLELTGTKEGCSNGNCGACTVNMDGYTVDSCCVLGVEAENSRIETIENFGTDPDKLHPIQESFIRNGGLQCGICTPGLIISTQHLLRNIPEPTEQEIRLWLAGNLCRCTGYDKIILSVQDIIGLDPG
ncbi:MAG: (2Fe-2S)-binding protein [Chloroflexota bacterium]|jgi:carbon-monoxide dehydrogenase small subunit|nr:(2Fe-2S)-binding protein [Chloroflexota bacterium]